MARSAPSLPLVGNGQTSADLVEITKTDPGSCRGPLGNDRTRSRTRASACSSRRRRSQRKIQRRRGTQRCGPQHRTMAAGTQPRCVLPGWPRWDLRSIRSRRRPPRTAAATGQDPGHPRRPPGAEGSTGPIQRVTALARPARRGPKSTRTWRTAAPPPCPLPCNTLWTSREAQGSVQLYRIYGHDAHVLAFRAKSRDAYPRGHTMARSPELPPCTELGWGPT